VQGIVDKQHERQVDYDKRATKATSRSTRRASWLASGAYRTSRSYINVNTEAGWLRTLPT